MQKPSLTQLQEQQFDVVVIGGGVIGAGIARDASLRGLRVALFEKDDFAAGTSSTSTRLAHGGLRYLEMLDFGLVRQDLGEREKLLRIAPHLVKPLRFVVPLWSRNWFYRTKLKIGMILYDLLSYDKSLPNHTFWNREELLQREPMLNPDGLQGALCYYDAQIPSTERLVLENVLDAAEHGAQIWNHTTVTGLLRSGDQVYGVQVRNEQSGETADVRARLVINAAGPWLDGLTTKLLDEPSHRVRMTKGIHFTAPPACNHALVLFAQQDNRLFFVIPWNGYSWVGTTDTDYNDSPDKVRANGEDVDYLRDSVETFLPEADWEQIYFTTAGLRALVRKEGVSESAVSRKHALVDFSKTEGLNGIMSVVGGKLTAYRGIAEEAVDMACKKLGVSKRSQTARVPLPGARVQEHSSTHDKMLRELQERIYRAGAGLNLSDQQIDYLLHLYGLYTLDLFELARTRPELAERIHPNYPDIRAQIVRAITAEYCTMVDDFIFRRTMLGFSEDQGKEALPVILDEMGKLLNWTAQARQRQEERYQWAIRKSQAFREELKPTTSQAQVSLSHK
ncbi:glycerol-3-phosphate dehydrogenase [Thermosporothrix hazakensis]|jgi:glycerol-3-phosphate dehydrogenase|uniref:Glycerol-3-phosphate dehydrogenase n=2 Tax=Thermosporothrix TaxID=768650 RepID=A0A326U7X7_THEHA|nr:glycerol-3-phosphate dehydrogenase [Thermosporothrix hazakensis]PZW27387.1 glycerol-3-phosphate dehydrogenase [Thermosporothrix hazakensis]BBH86017.1 glycerol-3-phosphate dehydrogenase [Thermosporothrix sp. COM3]GCE45556.1 glycerol-3-phosphate dehydrogenase [Thermosporothrix hazakensis]